MDSEAEKYQDLCVRSHRYNIYISILITFNIINYWLVVLTILKNISQWEGLSHVLRKIKYVPNHQPDYV
jgi:hypothetical protein